MTDDPLRAGERPHLLTERERDMVIAGLRLWQAHDRGKAVFTDTGEAQAIQDIAENGRTDPWCHLDEDEIDDLAARLAA